MEFRRRFATAIALVLLAAGASTPRGSAWAGVAQAADVTDRTGTVRGRVADAETKAAVVGASIRIAAVRREALSREDGAFEMTGIPPGEYALEASRLGYRPLRITISVAAGATLTQVLSLVPDPLSLRPILVPGNRAVPRETPATFSDLERAALEERYTVQDVPVLLAELPATTSYSESGTSVGYNYVTIRGFDQRRLAILVNGVPQNDPEDHNVYWLDFNDLASSLESIQVQRGAGSAFFGPPAIGGSINLVTTGAVAPRAFSLESGTGDYDTRKHTARFSTGLLDGRYALDARLSRTLSDNYRDRAWIDYSSYFVSAARFDRTLTSRVNFYGGPVADHLAYYGIPRAWVKDRDLRKTNPIARREEIENFSQPHYELLNEWRPSPSLAVNSTLFLVDGEGFFDYDASWADTTYFGLVAARGFHPTENVRNALIRAFVDNRQYGWLPRASWRGGRTDVTAGLELRRHRSLHWGGIPFAQGLPDGFDPDFRHYEYRGGKDVASAYLHGIRRLGAEWTGMLDLQLVWNRYLLFDEKYAGTDFTVDYRFLNPRTGLNWNLSPVWNVYTNLAYTSREPRLNNLYDAGARPDGAVPQFETRPDGTFDFDAPLVKPENLLDWELGAARRGTRATASANLFWMSFRNEIVKSGQVDRFGQPITGNAERSRHVGVEVAGAVLLPRGFEASVNATLSRNRLVRHRVFESDGDGVSEAVLDGNPIAGFPDFLANGRVTWRGRGTAASLALQHVGRQYTDNFEIRDRTVDPYTVLNGSLSVTPPLPPGIPEVTLTLQGNNLLDRLYASHGEGEEFFVAAERHWYGSVRIGF